MTEPRQIALVNDYDGLIAALNARAAELNLTRATIDAISGLQGGYSTKLLAPVPSRTFGRVSLGPVLQALGLALAVVVDPVSVKRFESQYAERQIPVRADPSHGVVEIRITRRKLRLLARRGGEMRAQNMTPKQRQRSARKAAIARWRREPRA